MLHLGNRNTLHNPSSWNCDGIGLTAKFAIGWYFLKNRFKYCFVTWLRNRSLLTTFLIPETMHQETILWVMASFIIILLLCRDIMANDNQSTADQSLIFNNLVSSPTGPHPVWFQIFETFKCLSWTMRNFIILRKYYLSLCWRDLCGRISRGYKTIFYVTVMMRFV